MHRSELAFVWGSIVACPMLGLVRSGLGRTKEMVRLEVCLPSRMVRWLCVCFGRTSREGRPVFVLCRYPRVALGWSEAGADLRPMPLGSWGRSSSLRAPVPHAPGLPNSAPRTYAPQATWRQGTIRGYHGGDQATSGRQAEAPVGAPLGVSMQMSGVCRNSLCLGTVVYKVTQGPLARGRRFLSSFPPLARECFFLLELESWPECRFTIVALVATSIYTTIDAAVGVLSL